MRHLAEPAPQRSRGTIEIAQVAQFCRDGLGRQSTLNFRRQRADDTATVAGEIHLRFGDAAITIGFGFEALLGLVPMMLGPQRLAYLGIGDDALMQQHQACLHPLAFAAMGKAQPLGALLALDGQIGGAGIEWHPALRMVTSNPRPFFMSRQPRSAPAKWRAALK